MSNWSEIKDLADQLKTVQLSGSANYISDRTCVDIVSHILSSHRLELVRTTDGRSLLTPSELDHEIMEELEAQGGHTSLLEISSNLDVDFSVIESRVQGLLSEKSQDYPHEQCLLVGGDFMTKGFVRKMAEEIRDRFEFRGSMSTIELTRMYSFPPQFIMNIIKEYNGKIFKVQQEGDKFYTDSYLQNQKAKVLGYFSGVITPVAVSTACGRLGLPQQLVTSLIESLISTNKIKGTLASSRTIYNPLCYSRAQDAYVTSFFTQNGYIEWNFVRRIGISDPSTYLRSHFPTAVHTKDFSISNAIVSQLKGIVAEALADNQWIDVSQYLPQNIGSQEKEWIIEPLLKNTNFVPLNGYKFLCPMDFIKDHLACFDEFLREKSVVAANDRKPTHNQKFAATASAGLDENFARGVEKKGRSGGFGVRGAREVKTKNVKKKYMKKSTSGSDSDSEATNSLPFEVYLPRQELFKILSSKIGPDATEDFVEGVLDRLLPEIHDKFSSLAKSVLLQTSDTSKNKDTFLAEKNSLISTILKIQLLERGALSVDDADLRTKLLRQLIRSDVSTFVNRLCILISQNYDVEWPTGTTSSAIVAPSVPGVAGKKGKRRQQDSQEGPHATAVSFEPSETDPSEITAQQRDGLVNILGGLAGRGAGPIKEASTIIQEINACLRGNPAAGGAGGKKLPLDEVFELCDNLASSHLGVNLSVSVHRGEGSGASKRKRQDRALALDLAAATEYQLIVASTDVSENATANVTLAAAGLFGQCLAGWPLPVHGKLVPHLTTWISAKLATESTAATTVYSTAIKELRIAKAGEQLNRLKEEVMQKARGAHGEHEDTTEVFEEVKVLVEKIVATAKVCRKAMVTLPGVPTS